MLTSLDNCPPLPDDLSVALGLFERRKEELFGDEIRAMLNCRKEDLMGEEIKKKRK